MFPFTKSLHIGANKHTINVTPSTVWMYVLPLTRSNTERPKLHTHRALSVPARGQLTHTHAHS